MIPHPQNSPLFPPPPPSRSRRVAEVNICPPMAAIANAIERAVGRRLTEQPMSPPKVLAAIDARDRKSTRLNSSHSQISYAVFCLKKKNNKDYYSLVT